MRSVALEAVSLAYGPRAILNALDLDVAAGERVALLGPSGCGKTSVLRLIAGFLAPDRGSVRLGGELAASDGRILVSPERRRVGMIFQDLALWPHLTVHGNLAFGLKARRVPVEEREERIRDALEMVGLSAFAQAKPSRLSGGEQQRVALVRALVLRPEILLMDEPLTNLDEALNRQLRGELLRIHDELGFTLIYVTHRADEAAQMAQTIVTLSKLRGRLDIDPGSPRAGPAGVEIDLTGGSDHVQGGDP
jgi:iron(III) transport system ATP-binding protein